MASTSVASFNNFDKENDVGGSHLSARTPHSLKASRLPSASDLSDDAPLKPGQRSLSNSTPNLNRAALHNVKNTPLKGAGQAFKTPVAVRPKVKQSPAVSEVDPLMRTSSAVPLDDEDYVGEFVAPSDRVSAYIGSFIKCTPLAFWGFPCIPFTGSTSDEEEEEENAYLSRKQHRQLDDSTRLDNSIQLQQIQAEQHHLKSDVDYLSSPISEDDLLPVDLGDSAGILTVQ